MNALWWVPVLAMAAVLPWASRRIVGRPPRPGSAMPPASAGSTGGAAATAGGAGSTRSWWSTRAASWRPAPQPGEVDAAVLADILRAAIQAGASIPTALIAVGRALPGARGRQFTQVAATLRLGGTWQAAWEHADADLHVLARVLQPAWDDGVAPGALLTHAANDIRRRRADAAREAAARLGVRLVLPMGLCWLPAFVLLGLAPVLLSTGGSLWP